MGKLKIFKIFFSCNKAIIYRIVYVGINKAILSLAPVRGKEKKVSDPGGRCKVAAGSPEEGEKERKQGYSAILLEDRRLNKTNYQGGFNHENHEEDRISISFRLALPALANPLWMCH